MLDCTIMWFFLLNLGAHSAVNKAVTQINDTQQHVAASQLAPFSGEY